MSAAGCHFVVIGADLYVFKYVSQRKGIFQEELIQNLKDYMKQEGLIKDEDAEEWNYFIFCLNINFKSYIKL